MCSAVLVCLLLLHHLLPLKTCCPAPLAPPMQCVALTKFGCGKHADCCTSKLCQKDAAASPLGWCQNVRSASQGPSGLPPPSHVLTQVQGQHEGWLCPPALAADMLACTACASHPAVHCPDQVGLQQEGTLLRRRRMPQGPSSSFQWHLRHCEQPAVPGLAAPWLPSAGQCCIVARAAKPPACLARWCLIDAHLRLPWLRPPCSASQTTNLVARAMRTAARRATCALLASAGEGRLTQCVMCHRVAAQPAQHGHALLPDRRADKAQISLACC